MQSTKLAKSSRSSLHKLRALTFRLCCGGSQSMLARDSVLGLNDCPLTFDFCVDECYS
jgi:hypothetical protein